MVRKVQHCGWVRARPQIFVAGATGRTGARIVRELAKAGFKVRAGVRDVEAAQKSLDIAEAYGILDSSDVKAITLVPVDFSKSEAIKAAIGPARKVVSALGAAENDALNFANVKKVSLVWFSMGAMTGKHAPNDLSC